MNCLRRYKKLHYLLCLILLVSFIQVLLFYQAVTLLRLYPYDQDRVEKTLIRFELAEKTESKEIIQPLQMHEKYEDVPSEVKATMVIEKDITDPSEGKETVVTENSHILKSCGANANIHSYAESAIDRAKTQECRDKIRDIACQNELKSLYWTNMTKLCGQNSPNRTVTLDTNEPVRILYALVIHGRAFRQVRRLFKAIFHKDHFFYIHVDSRSDYLYRKVQEMTSSFDNVRVTSWRMATIWGGASLLEMLLRLMEEGLAINNWKWDFFINLSAACYPVQANKAMVKYLKRHRGESFLSAHGEKESSSADDQSMYRTFVECDQHLWRVGKRHLPVNIEFYSGSDWLVLDRRFVEYIIHGRDALVLGLKHLYKYTLLPAESFFITLIRNSAFCDTLKTSNFHKINWDRDMGCLCQYKQIVDWCGCSPMDYQENHLEKIKKRKNRKFFARKFEPIVSNEIINKVDDWVYGSSSENTVGLHHYWENFYSSQDDDIGKFDVYRTYLDSFARKSVQNITSQANKCHLMTPVALQEGTYLTKKDHFEGVLTLYNVIDGGEEKTRSYTLETLFKPKYYRKLMNKDLKAPANRLVEIDIGMQYDVKERMYRNLAKMIGPYDDVVVTHQYNEGEKININIQFINPNQKIVATYGKHYKRNITSKRNHKADLKKPMAIGEWTVRIQYKNRTLGEVKYLVLPQAYNHGKHINSDKALDTISKTQKQNKELSNTSIPEGDELIRFIDESLIKYWNLDETCVSGETKIQGCENIPLCQTTTWSSKSPDPKSEIGKIRMNGGLR